MWTISKMRFTSYALIIVALGLIAATTQEVTNALSELMTGFMICGGYISSCRFIFWAVMVILIFLLGVFLDVFTHQRPTNFINSPKKQQKLTLDLKIYADKNANNIEISYANIRQKPLAESLKSIFDLAGWQTQPLGLPLESYLRDRYFKGVEVKGFSKHLVESVAQSLSKAGFSGVYTVVDELKIKPESPKYLWSLSKTSKEL